MGEKHHHNDDDNEGEKESNKKGTRRPKKRKENKSFPLFRCYGERRRKKSKEKLPIEPNNQAREWRSQKITQNFPAAAAVSSCRKFNQILKISSDAFFISCCCFLRPEGGAEGKTFRQIVARAYEKVCIAVEFCVLFEGATASHESKSAIKHSIFPLNTHSERLGFWSQAAAHPSRYFELRIDR